MVCVLCVLFVWSEGYVWVAFTSNIASELCTCISMEKTCAKSNKKGNPETPPHTNQNNTTYKYTGAGHQMPSLVSYSPF